MTGVARRDRVAPDALRQGDRAAGSVARRARIAGELAAVARAGTGEPCRRAETLYRPGRPLDVALTLSPIIRGASNPTVAIDRATGDRWIATRTEAGGASVCIRAVREGARVVAFGPGAQRAVELAPELLGRGDDWSGLDARTLPRPLAEAWRRNPGLRLCRSNAVFETMSHIVLEQKVTGLEAHRAWAWLHRRHATPAPGPAGVVPPALVLPLSAEQWRRVPSWDWHRAGVDHARSTTVLRAAEVAAALERTLALGRGCDEITARLRSVRGVGVWTAAETTQRSHGDPDAPSFGDYHVAHRVGYALTGSRVDDEGMRDLLEPWRGHRQRIVRLIGLAGLDEPRRGPRMTVEDHRAR